MFLIYSQIRLTIPVEMFPEKIILTGTFGKDERSRILLGCGFRIVWLLNESVKRVCVRRR